MRFLAKKTEDMRADELLRRGREAFDENEYEKGIRFLSSLIERHPEHLDGRILLADCHMKLKQYDEVYNQCEYILKIEPNHATAYFSYGLALVRDSKYEEGMEKLKRATELAPRNDHFKDSYQMMKYAARRLDITGLGAKYTSHADGMVTIRTTEILTEIAEKCLEEDKAVSLYQVCIECNEMPEDLPKFLNLVSENTGIKWRTMKIGKSDFMVFERP